MAFFLSNTDGRNAAKDPYWPPSGAFVQKTLMVIHSLLLVVNKKKLMKYPRVHVLSVMSMRMRWTKCFMNSKHAVMTILALSIGSGVT